MGFHYRGQSTAAVLGFKRGIKCQLDQSQDFIDHIAFNINYI